MPSCKTWRNRPGSSSCNATLFILQRTLYQFCALATTHPIPGVYPFLAKCLPVSRNLRRREGRPPSQPPCASPEVLVRTKIFLDQHQNLFRPAPKLQRFRRSNYRQASPDSSTLTTDSRSGRETPKTTYRNAPQPLSKRVRRISTLKNG